MKISIYNAKGGVGKSPIATNIILDYDFAIATNEAFHNYNGFIEDSRLLNINHEERFPVLPDNINVVFDLAGSISKNAHSITSALNQSDYLIVPVNNEERAIIGCLGTLNEIRTLNLSKLEIVIVATKLKKGYKEFFSPNNWNESNDYINIKRVLRSMDYHYPVLPLKYSKAFETISDEEKSIRQICLSNKLANYTYREVNLQMEQIYKQLQIKNQNDE